MQPNLPPFARGLKGLENLAIALESEQQWRDKIMSWDFSIEYDNERIEGCGAAGCALGLAYFIWPEFTKRAELDTRHRLFQFFRPAAEEIFDIPTYVAQALFYDSDTYGHRYMKDVEPGEVAAKIREYLADQMIFDYGGDEIPSEEPEDFEFPEIVENEND